MAKITFIGTGAWASALATVLTKNENDVVMWGIDNNEINDINKGINSKYFNSLRFNKSHFLRATNNLSEALKEFDFLVLAVPSNHIVPVLKQISTKLDGRKINLINVAKGIDEKTNNFFSEVLTNEFQENIKNYCTLIGPSFAIEVFENKLTMINIVGPNKNFLKDVQKIFNNDTFRLVINKNERGSELFAALKNVLAIGIGMINYYHPYNNPQAALLSIGVKEIHTVYKTLYPHSSDNIGFELAGIGDIFLTCSSPKSRNFSFGRQVAEMGIKKTLKINKKTIEGYYAAENLNEIIKNNNKLHIPFLKSIIDVLFNNKNEKKLLDFIQTY
ncbi:NAD(P)H-dependent glycerol-3-phosphate dehydrogenase [Mycoplasmopsis lipofaciens]|uniref:NAD(P)H-dependent glycerol-3-phosphate dehydrogenase n=1 Tax=Mycoplasmopsis lipofaciens TaxID=114884 RepID=UPI000484D90E|nr:NAD(P)H-dependent glycerol-3-phosphate dehydrogenase [Mycoplasmopsis lipofaciens]